MSICQAENGFSLDELVKKFTDAFENKDFADILIGAILCMFMIDSRLSIKNILTCNSKNTAHAAQADLFTSDHREQLHPPSHKATVDRQARLLGCLVKMSRLHFITPWQGRKLSVLSEELLFAQKREVKP